jgi:hypothetical protein
MQRPGYSKAAAVTQSDTVNCVHGMNVVKAIYCGGASAQDLKILTSGGSTVVLTGVQPGTILPLNVRRVFDTGTGFADAALILLGD